MWREPHKSETFLYLERGGSVSSVLQVGGVVAAWCKSHFSPSHSVVQDVRGGGHASRKGQLGAREVVLANIIEVIPARFRSLDLSMVFPDCHSMGWGHPVVPNVQGGSRWVPSALRGLRSGPLAEEMGPLIVVLTGLGFLSGSARYRPSFLINQDSRSRAAQWVVHR